MNSFQENILESIDILAKANAKDNQGALAIECTISSIEDLGIGLYTVEYLENTFNAYSSNVDVQYSVGDKVFILVPDGDFTKHKVILGATAPTASIYAPSDETDNYIKISDNLFNSVNNNDIVELCSYKSETRNINCDYSNFAFLFSNYLKNYHTISLNMKIKTNLPVKQQSSGNYGIKVSLPFKQLNTNSEIESVYKTFIVNIHNILGNPYRLMEWTPQTIYFDIEDGLTYDSSKTPIITAFVQDFAQDASIKAADIFIKNIGLDIVDVLTEEDISGYYLSLTATEGEYFLKDQFNAVKTLNPTLKVNGKNTKLTSYDCYWFVEDSLIRADSPYFNSKGGLGWKCLNERTNVSTNEDGSETFSYISNVYTYNVNSENVKTSLRYKCVVDYGGILVSGIIKLENLNSQIKIELVSKTGSNVFVKDTGYVDLLCKVYYPGLNSNTILTYDWNRFDKNDVYIDNDFYDLIKSNEYQDGWFTTEIKYPTNKMVDINSLVCTVAAVNTYNNEVQRTILGSSSIIVSTSADFTYILSMQNADKLFKYDADGNSPLVANYDGPTSSVLKEISPLIFRIYKADGLELTADEYKYCTAKWSIPKNSMISLTSKYDKTKLPQDDNYYYIEGKGQVNVAYTISSIYSTTKRDNVVLLEVTFNNNKLQAQSTIKFVKDGESGTNGSKYAAVLQYNNKAYGELLNNVPQKLKFVFINGGGWRRYNTAADILVNWDYPKLTAVVYKDGEKITSGYSVEWSIFDSGVTNPCFSIDKNSGTLNIVANWTDPNAVYCNTVQAKIKVSSSSTAGADEYIYAYYPLEITYINDANIASKIIPTLNGGYSSVLYASDGTNPKYDNANPFVCEDSLHDINNGNYYAYTWNYSENLRAAAATVLAQTADIRPVTKFDNGVSKNYVKVNVKLSESQRAIFNNLIQQALNNAQDSINHINFYTNEKNMLATFLTNYKYNNLVTLLDNSYNVLSVRATGIDFLDKSIAKVQELKTYYKNSKLNVKELDWNNTVANQENQIKEMKSILFNLGISTDLNSVHGISAILADKIIDLYNQKFQFEYYDSSDNTTKVNQISMLAHLTSDSVATYLYTLALDLKSLINNSNVSLTNIKGMSINSFVTFIEQVRQIADLMNGLASAHDGIQANSDFVNIQTAFRAMYGYFNNETLEYYTYKQIKQNILENGHNLMLKYGDQSGLSTYANAYYAEKIQEYTDKKAAYQAQVVEYQNMITALDRSIVHIKPIVLLFNRYEMSALNGWDGNKLYTDNAGTYMLAPQVGAGKKESDNSFTGVLMGVRKAGTKTDVGLFGMHAGAQSIFLNSEDGSATFGESGKGQVIIQPSADKAIIKSGNYYKGTQTTGKGLQIDLTTPEIRFGSGNFVVSPEGHITAKGGGTVAGWEISDTTLKSTNKNLTMDSNYAIIYSNTHSELGKTNDGFYIGADGMSIGNSIRMSQNKVEVGRVSGNRKWTISGDDSNSYIGYNTNSFNNNSNSVYLGTDGISLGHDKFYVNRDGYMVSTSGAIAGWDISASSLSKNNMEINSNGSIKGGSSYPWQITADGTATFKNIIADNTGNIAGWKISASNLKGGNISLNSNGSIDATNWKITTNGVAYFQNVICTNDGAGGTASYLDWKQNGASVFKVDGNGNLLASLANVTGTVTATAGKIGEVGIKDGAITSANGNFSVSKVGNLTAKNATFSGTISASGVKFDNGSGGYITMNGSSNHPEVSGLNVGSYGIVTNAGIDCHNIGNNDGYMLAKGTWHWGGTADIVFGGNNQTLGEFIDSKISNIDLDNYAEKGSKVKGKIHDSLGGSCDFELSI